VLLRLPLDAGHISSGEIVGVLYGAPQRYSLFGSTILSSATASPPIELCSCSTTETKNQCACSQLGDQLPLASSHVFAWNLSESLRRRTLSGMPFLDDLPASSSSSSDGSAVIQGLPTIPVFNDSSTNGWVPVPALATQPVIVNSVFAEVAMDEVHSVVSGAEHLISFSLRDSEGMIGRWSTADLSTHDIMQAWEARSTKDESCMQQLGASNPAFGSILPADWFAWIIYPGCSSLGLHSTDVIGAQIWLQGEDSNAIPARRGPGRLTWNASKWASYSLSTYISGFQFGNNGTLASLIAPRIIVPSNAWSIEPLDTVRHLLLGLAQAPFGFLLVGPDSSLNMVEIQTKNGTLVPISQNLATSHRNSSSMSAFAKLAGTIQATIASNGSTWHALRLSGLLTSAPSIWQPTHQKNTGLSFNIMLLHDFGSFGHSNGRCLTWNVPSEADLFNNSLKLANASICSESSRSSLEMAWEWEFESISPPFAVLGVRRNSE